MARMLVPAAFVAAAVLFTAASPIIAAPTDVPSTTVRYDELNLQSDAGVKTLYSRLRAAAKQVCAALDGRSLREQMDFHNCVTASLDRAVREVRNDAVLALHNVKSNGARRG